MVDIYKSDVKFTTLDKYLRKLNPTDRVHIVSDDFYVNATVYVLRSDMRSLLPLEVAYNEYFPFTLYI